jgi:hypothetical protein
MRKDQWEVQKTDFVERLLSDVSLQVNQVLAVLEFDLSSLASGCFKIEGAVLLGEGVAFA